MTEAPTHGAVIAARNHAMAGVMAPLIEFFMKSAYAERMGDADICDFTFGNPQELALPDFVASLHRWIEPQNKNWYAYTQNVPDAQAVIAAELAERLGLPFTPDDIAMTTGAFGALATAFDLCLDAGDEVIILPPPWFNYESMAMRAGGRVVKVPLLPDTFDLDLDGIAAAIGQRTRMIVVNTPHNPTGRMFPADQLAALADILSAAERAHGRPIVLLSDEPYRRLMFDGRQFESPASHYPHTMISYSYGKVLLTPGARIGYLAFSPQIAERVALRDACAVAQINGGWLYPNAVLQYAIGDLEKLSIDLDELTHKRDRLTAALAETGYQVNAPDGTFYLLVKSPIADDVAFCDRLAAHDVFVLPGSVCELPGYLRLCLTATEDMIERSRPGFRAAFGNAAPA